MPYPTTSSLAIGGDFISVYSFQDLFELQKSYHFYYEYAVGNRIVLNSTYSEQKTDSHSYAVLVASTQNRLVELFATTLIEMIELPPKTPTPKALNNKLLCLLMAFASFKLESPYDALEELKWYLEAYWLNKNQLSPERLRQNLFHINSDTLRQSYTRLCRYRNQSRGLCLIEFFDLVENDPNPYLKQVLIDSCESGNRSDLSLYFFELIDMPPTELLRFNFRKTLLLFTIILTLSNYNNSFIYHIREIFEERQLTHCHEEV